MKKPDLMKECRERGLPVSGTRAHLISLLVRVEGKGDGGGKLPVRKLKVEEKGEELGGIRRKSRRLAGKEAAVEERKII